LKIERKRNKKKQNQPHGPPYLHFGPLQLPIRAAHLRHKRAPTPGPFLSVARAHHRSLPRGARESSTTSRATCGARREGRIHALTRLRRFLGSRPEYKAPSSQLAAAPGRRPRSRLLPSTDPSSPSMEKRKGAKSLRNRDPRCGCTCGARPESSD
jgi:hypothetical protein